MQNNFEKLARAGYAARGVVYVLLGGLALLSAFWGGSQPDGSSDALSSLLALPFGRIVLALIALGLVGHVLWRLAQGLLDADHKGSDAKGFVNRAASLVAAGANVFLLLTTIGLAMGTSSGGGGGGEEEASGWLLRQPFGPFLLGAVAAGIVVAGCIQIWYGPSRKYKDRLDLPSSHRGVLDAICVFGLTARGVLFVIVGGFIGYAAWTVSPEQAGGISDALNYVHALPFGPWLYGIVALGLVAFGGYSVVQALYRHVDAPTMADVKRAVPG